MKMPSSPKKRPPISATATTPAAISLGGDAALSKDNRPISPQAAALSSALRPQGDSLSARGGTPHNHTAFSQSHTALGLTSLVAMDLQVPEPDVPTPTIEISSSSSGSSTVSSSDLGGAPLKRGKKSVDKGYDGDTVRERLTSMKKSLESRNGGGIRDYLSGKLVPF